jgi:outer membrane protein assembly factor BamB
MDARRASAKARLCAGLSAAALAAFVAGCGNGDQTRPPAPSRTPTSTETPSVTQTPLPTLAAAWPMYGGGLDRRFFNPGETQISAATVAQLVPRWRFLTDAVVMAAPVVADVAVPGGPVTRVVFVSSWDRNFYALRTGDGTLLWSYRFKTQPGSAYQQSSTAAVADVGGQRRVYVGSGETMYCLDAASGALLWQFDAGSGCTTCDRETERNDIASSPAVFDGTVYFGMDVNELHSGRGGLFAVDAETGTLRWYFDVESGATCHAQPSDAIRQFDGFHSAAALHLPAGFLDQPGCNFDRTPDGCGNIWSSPSIDVGRRELYITTANCHVAASGSSASSPYDEAVIAMTLDGTPTWSWRPRPIDFNDLDFGSPPNLFQVVIGGVQRDVLGAGAKDGTYYLLDRDGVNQLTGVIEPYWTRNVVPGGSQGGIIAPAAVGDGLVLFSTAIGGDANDPANYQKPTAWGLSATDGSVRWSSSRATPSFAPTSAIPGVAFMGSLLGRVYAYDSSTGAVLTSLQVNSLGVLAGQSSPPVIVDGTLYVGAGTAAREGPPESASYQASLVPSPLTAFCIAGTPDCPAAGECNDANPCSADTLTGAGSCSHSPLPDGTACAIGAFAGTCQSGVCTLTNPDCDDHNQCTIDSATATGCTYQSAPAGTPCDVNGQTGTCQQGFCNYGQPLS